MRNYISFSLGVYSTPGADPKEVEKSKECIKNLAVLLQERKAARRKARLEAASIQE